MKTKLYVVEFFVGSVCITSIPIEWEKAVKLAEELNGHIFAYEDVSF